MDEPLEAAATAHESLSALLHAIDPLILIRIACAAAGLVEPGELIELRYRNPRAEVPARSRRARGLIVDLVYTIESGGRVVGFWIFEVELSFSWEKVWRWALYEVALEAEYRASGRLAVFSPEPELRNRIRTKLLPLIKTDPIMIEPDQIERITDYEDARRRPELTILGCLYHVHEPEPFEARVAVFRAAWVAIQSLAELEALRYNVIVMTIVAPNVVEQGISELRESGELDEARWKQISDSERKGHSFHRGREEGRAEGREEGRAEGREEGRAEGREEGRAELLRRAVVDVLELRGFVLSQAHHQRIESCESSETLERWYAAAKAAAANLDVDQLLC